MHGKEGKAVRNKGFLLIRQAIKIWIVYSFLQILTMIFCMPLLFGLSHFWFLVFGHFWWWSYENAKMLRNLCLHFARQYGQYGEKTERNHATKVTKIPKTKIRKYGKNSFWPLPPSCPLSYWLALNLLIIYFIGPRSTQSTLQI